jgi:hypothetical protein
MDGRPRCVVLKVRAVSFDNRPVATCRTALGISSPFPTVAGVYPIPLGPSTRPGARFKFEDRPLQAANLI